MSLQEAINSALAKEKPFKIKLPRIKRPKLTREEWNHSPNPLMWRPKIPAKCGRNDVELKPEERISIDFADELRELTRLKLLDALWFHIPNEGKRGWLIALIMRAMGMIPGVADYIFIWRYMDAWKVAFIEVKAGDNKQTPEQWHFQLWAESLGIPYSICRSKPEAINKLAEWGAI